MFNKVIDKLFGGKKRPRRKPETATAGAQAEPAAKAAWERHANKTIDPTASPEELCGLRDGMTVEDLRERLALLYRRHNRAASSLDPKLRQEAEVMLEAIVTCRRRYLDGTED